MTRIILLGTLMFAACDNNGVGRKGETCQVRGDCAVGLACIFNVCTIDEFKISASAKGCDYVECNVAQDCINTNNFCKNLDEDCIAGDQILPIGKCVFDSPLLLTMFHPFLRLITYGDDL